MFDFLAQAASPASSSWLDAIKPWGSWGSAFAGCVSAGVALAALIIAKGAYGFNRRSFERKLKTDIQPVLVFTRKSSVAWMLENVGNGPAVEVVVGDKSPTGWRSITLCYPLGKSAAIQMYWMESGHSLAVKYRDIHDNWYTTECSRNRNYFKDGDQFPEWKVSHFATDKSLLPLSSA